MSCYDGMFISSETVAPVAANTQIIAGIIVVVWASLHSGPTAVPSNTPPSIPLLIMKHALPSIASDSEIDFVTMVSASCE